MTDEQINCAIADACGWRKEDGVYMWTANGIDCTCHELWDWCNDLNAMHQAEKTLTGDLQNVFVYELRWITKSKFWSDFKHCHASARQRAEAFLRVVGKWEDEK